MTRTQNRKSRSKQNGSENTAKSTVALDLKKRQRIIKPPKRFSDLEEVTKTLPRRTTASSHTHATVTQDDEPVSRNSDAKRKVQVDRPPNKKKKTKKDIQKADAQTTLIRRESPPRLVQTHSSSTTKDNLPNTSPTTIKNSENQTSNLQAIEAGKSAATTIEALGKAMETPSNTNPTTPKTIIGQIASTPIPAQHKEDERLANNGNHTVIISKIGSSQISKDGISWILPPRDQSLKLISPKNIQTFKRKSKGKESVVLKSTKSSKFINQQQKQISTNTVMPSIDAKKLRIFLVKPNKSTSEKVLLKVFEMGADKEDFSHVKDTQTLEMELNKDSKIKQILSGQSRTLIKETDQKQKVLKHSKFTKPVITSEEIQHNEKREEEDTHVTSNDSDIQYFALGKSLQSTCNHAVSMFLEMGQELEKGEANSSAGNTQSISCKYNLNTRDENTDNVVQQLMFGQRLFARMGEQRDAKKIINNVEEPEVLECIFERSSDSSEDELPLTPLEIATALRDQINVSRSHVVQATQTGFTSGNSSSTESKSDDFVTKDYLNDKLIEVATKLENDSDNEIEKKDDYVQELLFGCSLSEIREISNKVMNVKVLNEQKVNLPLPKVTVEKWSLALPKY